MFYELKPSFRYSLFEKVLIARENDTFIVVVAILASSKHRAFTWSYPSSI